MKKIGAVLLVAFLCLCTFTSCGAKTGARVNGTKLPEGVCLYLEEEVKKEHPKAEAEELEALLKQRIAEYVAVNSVFQERALSLSPIQKQALPQTVHAIWDYFGNYYEALGVTQQDVLKVETQKAAKDAVMLDYYTKESGNAPLFEAELHEFFVENYVAFQSVTGFLTTVDDNGASVSLSETEKAALLASFNEAAQRVNGGETLESVARTMTNVAAHTDTTVRFKGTTEDQQAFFTAVQAIENGKAGAFTVGEYVFLLVREDINGNDGLYYTQHKMNCLKVLRGEDFKTVLADWTKNYTVK